MFAERKQEEVFMIDGYLLFALTIQSCSGADTTTDVVSV